MNLYGFVGNNGTNYFDLLGLYVDHDGNEHIGPPSESESCCEERALEYKKAWDNFNPALDALIEQRLEEEASRLALKAGRLAYGAAVAGQVGATLNLLKHNPALRNRFRTELGEQGKDWRMALGTWVGAEALRLARDALKKEYEMDYRRLQKAQKDAISAGEGVSKAYQALFDCLKANGEQFEGQDPEEKIQKKFEDAGLDAIPN